MEKKSKKEKIVCEGCGKRIKDQNKVVIYYDKVNKVKKYYHFKCQFVESEEGNYGSQGKIGRSGRDRKVRKS